MGLGFARKCLFLLGLVFIVFHFKCMFVIFDVGVLTIWGLFTEGYSAACNMFVVS